MSSIASIAPLLGALEQLKLVQSLRAAIQAADTAAANAATSQPQPTPAVNQPSTTSSSSTTVVQTRRHIHPTPIVEPRQVIHLRPRIAIMQLQRPENPTPAPCPSSEPKHLKLFPQPVWDFLPWPTPAPHARQVKRLPSPPDISIKGSLIDIFV